MLQLRKLSITAQYGFEFGFTSLSTKATARNAPKAILLNNFHFTAESCDVFCSNMSNAAAIAVFNEKRLRWMTTAKKKNEE